MLEFLHKELEDKTICILGYGQEGQSSYQVIRKLFPEKDIHIADHNQEIESAEELRADSRVICHTGPTYLRLLETFDLIIKSPGISYNLIPHLSQKKITSQSELFIRVFREQIIGITGTKGKSTTSSLIYQIIRQQNEHVLLLGNIGIPPFSLIDDVKKSTLIVYELSSHQLQNISTSPKYSVILNLFDEHLDHYSGREEYFRAKLNIARFQQTGDHLIINGDDERLTKMIALLHSSGTCDCYSLYPDTDCRCSIRENEVQFRTKDKRMLRIPLASNNNLPGEHNLLNIMAACSISFHAGISEQACIQGLASFKPLPHRIEFVGEVEEILFYNDSIATIPEASMAGIEAVGNVDCLILGGYDRGIEYSEFAKYLLNSKIQTLIFMGPAGERIRDEIIAADPNTDKNLMDASSLKEAVVIGKNKTKKGKACLLSPAASSYDAYKNFAERGNAYKDYIFG